MHLFVDMLLVRMAVAMINFIGNLCIFYNINIAEMTGLS